MIFLNYKGAMMKKNYSTLTISLSIVFCACAIGISFIYLNRFFAFYLACAVISSIAFIACALCLGLRLKKYNGQEQYYKVLMAISMLSTAVSLMLIVIGTITIIFS